MAKGVEVLLLDDPVDEFWVPEAKDFKGKEFRSLTRGEVDLTRVKGGEDRIETPDDLYDEDIKRLIARLKIGLGDEVKDVRLSRRLRDSAVCLVADEQGVDLRLERFLKQHSQLDRLSKRVLEINGRHELIKRMAGSAKDEAKSQELDELAHLLLDQARIIEGEPIPDPGAFSRRMSTFLARGIVA
jgi:molecular chaperone HtpG